MNIIQRPSPNHGPRGAWKPDMIVNHITGGDTEGPAINTFLNPKSQVSAHFIVSKTGAIYQCVPLDRAAWANGTSAAGNVANSLSTLSTVRQRNANANLYTVSIEHVCVSGGALTPAQLAASIELHRHIRAELLRLYGVKLAVDLTHIVGHCEVAPKVRPSDPGADFPLVAILAALNGVTYKSDTTGVVEIALGAAYQLMLTGEGIPLVAGTSGVVQLLRCRREGDKTYWHLVPIGKPGQDVGIYRKDGDKAKICVAKIKEGF